MATSMWKTSVLFGRNGPCFLRPSAHRFSSKINATLMETLETSLDASEVEYPTIGPVGDEKKYLQTMEKIKSQPTVPDMIYQLNKQQCWQYQMLPFNYHPNFLQVYKHATKTHMVEGLPDYVTKFVNAERIAELAANVKNSVQDFASQEMSCDYKHLKRGIVNQANAARANGFVANLVNLFLLTELGQCPHILSGEFDHEVDVKSFWLRDDTRYQFYGTPSYLLRTEEPLHEFTSKDSELSVGEVESYPFKPQWYSIFKKHHNSICFPGLKHGNPITYGHTQFSVTNSYRKRILKDVGQSFLDEHLMGHGLISAFGWLAGLSMYHRHYWDDDLTQPMTCNTIVTNGKNFSFFCYQLNTIALHSRVSETNHLRNVCWYTKDAPLYETVTEDGEVVNFNVDVLKTIIGMLMMPPGQNMLEVKEESSAEEES